MSLHLPLSIFVSLYLTPLSSLLTPCFSINPSLSLSPSLSLPLSAAQEFKAVAGQNKFVGSLEGVTTVQKEKFPKNFWPDVSSEVRVCVCVFAWWCVCVFACWCVCVCVWMVLYV